VAFNQVRTGIAFKRFCRDVLRRFVENVYETIVKLFVLLARLTGRGLPGSVFVPRLARRVATEPRGGGPRRTGADHRVGHVAVAAAGCDNRPVLRVAASRLRDHAASRARHQTHVVAAGPDRGLQRPSARDNGPVHRPRAGRLRRRPGHHLQPRGPNACRRRGVVSLRDAVTLALALVVVPDGGGGRLSSARPARRRRHHQESRPRPDTRHPVTVGRQVSAPRRVSPSHGKPPRIILFKRYCLDRCNTRGNVMTATHFHDT